MEAVCTTDLKDKDLFAVCLQVFRYHQMALLHLCASSPSSPFSCSTSAFGSLGSDQSRVEMGGLIRLGEWACFSPSTRQSLSPAHVSCRITKIERFIPPDSDLFGADEVISALLFLISSTQKAQRSPRH